MSASHSNRRQFLSQSVTCVTGAAVLNLAGTRLLAQPGTARVRKDVATLTATSPDIVALKKAVTAMKALPAADLRNWAKFGDFHRASCPHGNWWFLPWHRAYLYYFEDLVRKYGEDEGFALPYWNWSKDRKLPALVQGMTNPLNDPTRGVGPNEPAEDEFVDQVTVIDPILALNNARDFLSDPAPTLRPGTRTGSLEGIPHNYIHGFVGGNMGTVARSPLDPIFWLHHCNIDRLWTLWKHPELTPSDMVWLNQDLAFADRDGNPASKKTSDVLSTGDLGYRYDTSPTPVATPPVTPIIALRDDFTAGIANNARLLEGRPLTIGLNVDQNIRDEINFLATANADAVENKNALVSIGPFDSSVPTGVRCRVFLNCPTLTPETPISDPHYIGSIAFFGGDHGAADGEHHEDHGPTFLLDISQTLRRLGGRGLYDPAAPIELSMTWSKTTGERPRAALQPKRFQLATFE